MRALAPWLLVGLVGVIACGKDESNSTPVPMQPKKMVDEPPPDGLIATGPTPPLARSARVSAATLAAGPERKGYDLARAGKLAEAAKLGAAATPGVLLALDELPRESTGPAAAIWNRLAASAPGGDRPVVIVRWVDLYAWRPQRLDIERELGKVLADARIDVVPVGTAAVDGVLMVEYREREGSRYDLTLDQGTGTGFSLKIDVFGFRKRAVTPIEVTGGPPDNFHMSRRTVASADEELYRMGLSDFRESLAASGVLIAAGLR
jgi:hypothetical protein